MNKKDYMKDYYLKNKVKLQKRMKIYNFKNRIKISKLHKIYYKNHKIKGLCSCGKEITAGSKGGRCLSCSRKEILKNPKSIIVSIQNLPKDTKGKNNGMFGKKRKYEIIKHHVDLNHENNNDDNIMKITSSIHTSLHHRAYDYLVKIGKIKQYIRWFFKQDFKQRRIE